MGSKIPQQQEFPNSMLNYLLLDGDPAPIPEAMRKIIDEIYEDLGSIPSSYLAVNDDMSGHDFRSVCRPAEDVLPEALRRAPAMCFRNKERTSMSSTSGITAGKGIESGGPVLRETTAPSGGSSICRGDPSPIPGDDQTDQTPVRAHQDGAGGAPATKRTERTWIWTLLWKPLATGRQASILQRKFLFASAGTNGTLPRRS